MEESYKNKAPTDNVRIPITYLANQFFARIVLPTH